YGDSGCDQPTQCASSGDPVNTASGNFWHTFDDLSIPGRGPALELARTYNSLAAGTDSPFGYGWTDSYAMSLDIGRPRWWSIRATGRRRPSPAPTGRPGRRRPGY